MVGIQPSATTSTSFTRLCPPEQIHTALGAGCSYRFIAHRFCCSFSSISKARTPSNGTTKKMGRTKKITPEIYSFIETASRLDACMTHIHIAHLITERWPDVKLSIASTSLERER
jgi:hypothetical protein